MDSLKALKDRTIAIHNDTGCRRRVVGIGSNLRKRRRFAFNFYRRVQNSRRDVSRARKVVGMAELPSMPIFIDAYEASTLHLSFSEDGAYNRLLRLLWRSPGCKVPNDERWLRKRLRCDETTFNRVVRPILKEFPIPTTAEKQPANATSPYRDLMRQ